MHDLLTPKQVARAIDVSESSVKRWCDKGDIPTHYTAGGHRRIALASILAWVRSGRHVLVHPEALGLPATSGKTHWVFDRARSQLVEALLQGSESVCLQVLLDLYLAGHSLSLMCDEIMAAAFVDIGDRWSCGTAEVYQERRGCKIAVRVIQQLQRMLPDVAANSPLAMGGTASGDHYSLGTNMVELVLRNLGWNAVSLGVDLPFCTLDAVLRDNQPRLFWLSCSHLADEDSFVAGVQGLHARYGKQTAFVLGGQALHGSLRTRLSFAPCGDNMQQLAGLASTLRQAETVPCPPENCPPENCPPEN